MADKTGKAPKTKVPSATRRLRLGLGLMLTLLLVVGGKLFLVQGLDVGGMAEAALNNRLTPVELPAERGSILDSAGTVLASSVIRYNIVVDQTVNTKTESFEFHGSIAPLQSLKSTLTLTAGLGFSNVTENDFYGPVYRDSIRTANLGADYKLQDNFGGTNYLTLGLRQGLDILGASHRDDDFLSRDDASGKFTALNFWYTRYQTLTDSFSLKIAGAGQWASGPLFTSQQFYLGGLAFGRGYGSAEISGDNGIAGSFELRFDQKLNYRYWSGYQLYSFVDAGTAWNAGYNFGDGYTLTSVGGGVRMFLFDDWQADIGVAVPLGYRAPDNSSRSARLLFSLSSAFKLCPARAATRCL